MKVFGKISGGDIIVGKKTFLYVKATEIASQEQRKKLQEIYASEISDPEAKIKIVTEIYDQLNIKYISENLAGDYLKSALSFLDKAGAPQERKEELIQMTTSLVGRER
jgi:geranylgeranyl diphosphate synthase type II